MRNFQIASGHGREHSNVKIVERSVEHQRQIMAAKTGFPKLHLHVLRSMARRLGSHLPETTITYHPADAFWWGVSPGVLIVSPDTVRLGEAHRLDPKQAA